MKRGLLALPLLTIAGCDLQVLVGVLADAGARPPTSPPSPTTEVNAATQVVDCPGYNTLGKMDLFFAMRCGGDALCHSAAIPWTDLKSPDVWRRMLDAWPRAACIGGAPDVRAKIIDRANWRNSVLLTKSQDPPACPSGTLPTSGQVGWPMPPSEENQGNLVPRQPPLTAEERLCIENFVRAATGN